MPFLDYAGLTTFWSKVKDILSGKQNTLTAGEGVSLENNTVSVQEPVKGVTQAQYDALSNEDKNTGLYIVTDVNYAAIEYAKTTETAPTVSSVSTQSLSVNSLNSSSQSSEKVLSAKVPLSSSVTYAPASAASTSISFAPASAASTSISFAPASAASAKLEL